MARRVKEARPLLVFLALFALWAGAMSRGAHHADQAPAGHRPRPVHATPRAPSVAVHVRRTGTLPAPVQLPAMTAVRGGALALGGLDAADASSAAIVRVAAGRPARVDGRLPAALHDAAAATLGTRTYFFGGGNARSASAAILRVDPPRAPVAAGRLPVGASDVAAAAIGSTAYVVGGYTGKVPLRSILAFRPGRRLALVGTLPRPLRYAAVAAVAGRLLIAGGTSGVQARREVLSFDPATRRVRVVARLPVPLTHAAAGALGGTLYVAGGRGDGLASQHRAIWAIDPARGRVVRAGHLPVALSDLGAASGGRSIVLLGGRDAAGRVHDAVYRVKPAAARPVARAAAHVPRLLDRHDVYAAGRPGRLSPVVRNDPPRVYVPNSQSNTVDVIDQRTARVVGHFATGRMPQHVTPSWDLRTLWVTNDLGNSLTPIDPRTGRHGRPVPVTDPYNLYFTADGRRAIVIAEAHRRLDFRTPHTMRLTHSLRLPSCAGADHMDFTADGRLALVSCEFAGRMVVVDLRRERALKTVRLSRRAMPQDVKLSPDGRTFYVADMASGGVWLIDARRLRVIRFQRTGRGAHGLYPSRDSRVLYVSNRGEGSISLISFRTRRPFRKWHLPGGGSPDMGGVSADGRVLWLSGRYDGVVYAISTRTGRLLHRIRVGAGPHGMCVWPQPGRYSIGHTGILR